MIYYKTYLEVDQANKLVTAFNQNQLHDLLPFLKIGLKGAKKSYRLCLDCPVDSYPRVNNKLNDVLDLNLVWEEYDAAMTPEFKKGLPGDQKEDYPIP
jgi:hypothetical protein|tara:strand:+ start:830 stop:1123 length:294 start_codon:yes stop_codon:yes gene_type:complete